MLGRQSVRVTYAHKRRRVQAASKAQLSSPLEVLPPETGDLTHTQMARRMLKRSRRVALTENFEDKDKNVEHIRDHLAKRIKHTQEHISNVESAPSDTLPGDVSFQTPFPASQSVHDPVLPKPSVPDQLSPVPVAKRVMSRTSSRSLKENGAHSRVLASPFSSRPSSAAPSPKHQGKGRSSRRVSRIPLNTRSRIHSGFFKENARHVPRKGSAASLKEPNKEPVTTRIKHQRYRSSPSTSYMRAQFTQDNWISPPKAISRTLDDDEELRSPGESIHNNGSFYTDQPRSCSTPATSRLRKLSKRYEQHAGVGIFPVASSFPKDPTQANNLDVEMMDGTVPQRRQTIHLSSNSIFSSGEFTIGTLPANNGRTQGSIATDRDEQPDSTHREAAKESRVGRTLAGSFLSEFEIPLSASPGLTNAAKMLDSGNVPKLSFGDVPFSFPGTSPAHGGNLIVERYRTAPSSPASDLAEELESEIPPFYISAATKKLDSRGATTASVRETGNIIVRGPRTPPSSPASGLAEELSLMGIRGGQNKHLNGDTHRLSAPVPLHTRSNSSQDAPANRKSARNRASTIRASDFAKPGVSSSNVASGSTASLLPSARRTRSGTVVGLNSRLATKGTGSSARMARGVGAVEPDPEESDVELLLKSRWIEDVEYLGLPVPANRKDVEADEMNLGGLWHGLEFGPPRRLGLRRR